MLGEEAARELQQVGRSEKFRQDCEMARLHWLRHPLTLDQFVQFLSDTNQLFPPQEPTSFVAYTNVRL